MSDVEANDEKPEKPIVIRNTTDLQRLKVEKLMKHPDKPVIIPERPKERGIPAVPDFVRNVMGSSAGAGSGEFHVYRHLRRKEYARQKYMKEKGERERMEQEYRDKIEENKKRAEEKTAKKRAKRLKRKQKSKGKAKKVKLDEIKSESSEEESDEVEEEEETENDQKENTDSHIIQEEYKKDNEIENCDDNVEKRDDNSKNAEAKLKLESSDEKEVAPKECIKTESAENGKIGCVNSIEKECGNDDQEQKCDENEKTNDISKNAEAKLVSVSNLIKEEHELDNKIENDGKDNEKVQGGTIQ